MRLLNLSATVLDEMDGASVQEHDDYVYLQCDECQDMCSSIREGDTLANLVANYREHCRDYHEED